MVRAAVALLTVAVVAMSWHALSAAETGAPATFEAGEGAYVALHFDEARRIYAAVAASAAQPARDRAAAWRQLGVMAWRLEGNTGEAESDLRQALAVGADLSTTEVELARFFVSTRRFDEAMKAADAAVQAAQSLAERKAASLALARVVLAELNGVDIAQQTSADLVALARARDVVRPFSDAPPMPLDLSEALLEIGLRLDDGPLALVAWNSYAREGEEAGAWAPAAGRLSAALPHWRAGERLPAQRSEVFEALRASQFFALAALVASDARLRDAAQFVQARHVAETIAYAQMVREMGEITDAYYRDIANGKGDAAAWRNALGAVGLRMWPKLDFASTHPAFSQEALDRELRARFGAVIKVGDTGGIDDMHYGHIFLEENRVIAQYGHRTEQRFIALDRMVSNGYQSWVWDGRQAHGGWANEGVIYQVRPAYADDALKVWARMNDAVQRAQTEANIARLSAADESIAHGDPAGYLPGLAMRLQWSGQNALVEDLKKAGLSGVELKRRFILDLSRVTLESSIFAHEGRHALDDLYERSKLNTEELEFRAKLSEVAFSERPRLSFGAIFNATILDTTAPHGRANKRIMQGLVAWMAAHRDAIAGLDGARPLLPQFDKLNDGQMRAAMRAMDPWANS